MDKQIDRLVSHVESEVGLAAHRDREMRDSVKRVEDTINGDEGIVKRLNGHGGRLHTLERWQTGLTMLGGAASAVGFVMFKVLWSKAVDRLGHG